MWDFLREYNPEIIALQGILNIGTLQKQKSRTHRLDYAVKGLKLTIIGLQVNNIVQ